MKTLMTTAMAALLSIGAAKANNLSTNNSNKAVESAKANSSVFMSVAELNEENVALKLKLANLAEETAELKSKLEFQSMMHTTINEAEQVHMQEKESEQKAMISYQQIMTNVLLKLNKAK